MEFEKLKSIISEVLSVDGEEIDLDTAFVDDLGADSIDLVELMMAFEDEYGITADYEEVDKRVKTVGDIIEFLKEQGADI